VLALQSRNSSTIRGTHIPVNFQYNLSQNYRYCPYLQFFY